MGGRSGRWAAPSLPRGCCGVAGCLRGMGLPRGRCGASLCHPCGSRFCRRPRGHCRSQPHGQAAVTDRFFRESRGVVGLPGRPPGSPAENVGQAAGLPPQGSLLGPPGPGLQPQGLWTHSPSAGPGRAGRCTGSWQTGSTCGARSPRQ